MRVVDVRDDHVDEDVKEGRGILKAEIDHPSMSVMIIRGDAAEISKFVDKASARCDPFPWRTGVWVRDDRAFPAGKAKAWFGGHDDACAVILDLNDDPAGWLAADAELIDIEQTWLQAEGKS